METAHIDFSPLKRDVQNLRDRTGAAEERISTVEDTRAPLTTTVHEASSKLAALCAKADALENRPRRNNLRFVGFPLKSEGANPEQFLLTWLRGTLGQNVISTSFAIERAHCTPSCPPACAPPRPLIARILHF